MSLKYSIGAAITAPLLPLLYFQGRKVKNAMPDLPEATGTTGVSGLVTNPRLKTLVIGESTMAGVGVETHQEGFAGTLGDELAEKLDLYVHWHVYAKSGITVVRVRDEVLPKIEDKDWDLIVVGIGGNDAFKLNSPRKWKEQVRCLITEIRNVFGCVPVVFTNMPPIKEFPAFTPLMKWVIGNLVELLGEALGEVVREFDHVYYSSEVISISDWVEELKLESDIALYFSDGVHPSKLTYQTLAKQLSKFIIKQINLSPA
ncbi:Lysophospholipase L1 [Reichenbachiella faecimaris]|uniref:Lysophospholipase L1 n=1 Tax=Reichenbachiella faecimaris TaxID=692418 RepID=A0A1W2GJK8_REIFA|nr:SGNH/GDSL hydrolase family protein [Reichenbachiella faecimaris]SMD36837.1 Lysophospholipase L1 [Reichenbachiella faecimaris]